MTDQPSREGERPLSEPPASYWPQIHEAVWDEDGVTCDADIEVVPASQVGTVMRQFRFQFDERERLASTLQAAEAVQERIGKQLDHVVPRESYEGQAGGIVEWTLEGRVDELIRRHWNFDVEKAWASRDARAAMADTFYRRAEAAEARESALRELLREVTDRRLPPPASPYADHLHERIEAALSTQEPTG